MTYTHKCKCGSTLFKIPSERIVSFEMDKEQRFEEQRFEVKTRAKIGTGGYNCIKCGKDVEFPDET